MFRFGVIEGKAIMSKKAKQTAIVLSQQMLAEGIYDLRLAAGEIAAQAVPGQFVSLYSKDGSRLLPRPIRSCIVTTARFAELIHAPHIIPQL